MIYKYESVAERLFNIKVRSGPEYMVSCIFHENSGSPSMQFNVQKGLYLCFSCGARGNIQSLLGMDTSLRETIYDGDLDLSDILSKLDALNAQAGRKPSSDVLPESYLKRYAFPTRYWELRGFTPTTVAVFDLGYDPMEDAAIIPIRNIKGELIGVIKRMLDPDAQIRYRYPKGFPRRSSLFASWLVAEDDRAEVAVVEGALDAAKVWQAGHPAVAQYGSSLSMEQVRLLKRLGVTGLVFFYDNDKAGLKAADGWDDKHKKHHPGALDLTRDFMVRRVRYTKSMPSDPGACTSEQINEVWDKAQEVTSVLRNGQHMT